MNLMLMAGLAGIQKSLINNWIGPVFIIVVAAIAIPLAFKREIRGLAMFALIATIAALLIFAGPMLFGSNGIFTDIGKGAVNQINTILPLR